MAVNSLGYFKHTIDCLSKSPFLPEPNGIYIKKSCIQSILNGSFVLKPESELDISFFAERVPLQITKEANQVESLAAPQSDPKDVKPMDDLLFVPGLDHGGADLFRASGPLMQLKDQALSLPECVAFNSLGYLKTAANNLTRSPYIINGDGIYIRKSYVEKLASGEIMLHPESNWTQTDAQLALMQH